MQATPENKFNNSVIKETKLGYGELSRKVTLTKTRLVNYAIFDLKYSLGVQPLAFLKAV
jgi:hypothetical protein